MRGVLSICLSICCRVVTVTCTALLLRGVSNACSICARRKMKIKSVSARHERHSRFAHHCRYHASPATRRNASGAICSARSTKTSCNLGKMYNGQTCRTARGPKTQQNTATNFTSAVTCAVTCAITSAIPTTGRRCTVACAYIERVREKRRVEVCNSLLQCIEVCCNALQSAAMHCSLLQCIAVCCNALHSQMSDEWTGTMEY